MTLIKSQKLLKNTFFSHLIKSQNAKLYHKILLETAVNNIYIITKLFFLANYLAGSFSAWKLIKNLILSSFAASLDVSDSHEVALVNS